MRKGRGRKASSEEREEGKASSEEWEEEKVSSEECKRGSH